MPSFFPPPSPQLPRFNTLLIQGSYHASAPIHLLLSHVTEEPQARAILLTPNRESLKSSLVELNDRWIDSNSGTGRNAAAARRIQVYYPPTIAHLRLLLTMLHEYDDVLHHAKTTLEIAPSLIVLHEISQYFDQHATQTTVSAYLSVISSALALATSWSPGCSTTSRLVIFDSGLSALKLPILRSLSFEDEGESEAKQRDALSVLLDRYIEWKAVFSADDDAGEAQTDDNGSEHITSTRSLELCPIGSEREAEGDGDNSKRIVWKWSERVAVDKDGREKTSFIWD